MDLNGEMGSALIGWFRKNKRTMAWRSDPTPYHVWVSEIMLQQTRVDTVHAYYARFLEAFPTVGALAEAKEEVLLKQWEGLGYYSRARNLQKAAQRVVQEYGGTIPDSFYELVKLPGVGSYTAGAILSIAFHKRFPVVDGNVLRVLSRVLGRTDDIRDARTKAEFEKELKAFLESVPFDPGEFNQGLMELGALVCVPNGRPKCEHCPWAKTCAALKGGDPERLPVSSPKAEKKTEEKTVFLVYEKDRLLVVRRSGKDVLNRLFGFPSMDGSLSSEKVRELFPEDFASVRRLPDRKHVFTHKIWEMTCFEIRLPAFDALKERFFRTVAGGEDTLSAYRFVGKEELEKEIALPTAFRKWPLFDFS